VSIFLTPALIVQENAVIICKHLRCGQPLAICLFEVRGLDSHLLEWV